MSELDPLIPIMWTCAITAIGGVCGVLVAQGIANVIAWGFVAILGTLGFCLIACEVSK